LSGEVPCAGGLVAGGDVFAGGRPRVGAWAGGGGGGAGGTSLGAGGGSSLGVAPGAVGGVSRVSRSIACFTACQFIPEGTETGTATLCLTPPETITSVPIATSEV
jgi:hypothetical protein